MNLFFALPLPDSLRASLGALPRPPLAATWAGAAGLHLTLAFMGPRPEDEPHLAEMLRSCAAKQGAFTLRTTRLGGFPSAAKARVLWLGVAEEPRLRALVEDLRERLRAAGLPFDAKPFAPHITLARMKVPADMSGLASPPSEPFLVDRLVLYRSRRLPEGARYEVLAEAPLLASSSPERAP